MKLRVKYFASLREALGEEDMVEVPDTVRCVRQLREMLVGRGGLHAEVLARGRPVRCAIRHRMCAEDEAISEGDEVAFFPPVTGG